MTSKKIITTLFLTFFLVGCPGSVDDYIITLHDFSIEGSCILDKNGPEGLNTCEDEFKIYLYFKFIKPVNEWENSTTVVKIESIREFKNSDNLQKQQHDITSLA